MTNKRKKPSRKTGDGHSSPPTNCSQHVLVTADGYRIDVSPLTVDEFRERFHAVLLDHLRWGQVTFPWLPCWKSRSMRQTLSANAKGEAQPPA